MSLSFDFNKDYRASKVNDYVLRVDSDGFAFTYDFAARHMLTWVAGAASSFETTPFAQVDREVLEVMREKLIALKGNPPELPVLPRAGSNPSPGQFNL